MLTRGGELGRALGRAVLWAEIWAVSWVLLLAGLWVELPRLFEPRSSPPPRAADFCKQGEDELDRLGGEWAELLRLAESRGPKPPAAEGRTASSAASLYPKPRRLRPLELRASSAVRRTAGSARWAFGPPPSARPEPYRGGVMAELLRPLGRRPRSAANAVGGRPTVQSN